MKTIRFEAATQFPVSCQRLWETHAAPGSLERLTPWWSPFIAASPSPRLRAGAEIALHGRRPLRGVRWRALVAAVEEGAAFTDIALDGPFPFWVHQHIFAAAGAGRSLLRDVVWLAPPRWLPLPLARPFLRLGLAMLFRARHRRVGRQLRQPSAAGRERRALASAARRPVPGQCSS